MRRGISLYHPIVLCETEDLVGGLMLEHCATCVVVLPNCIHLDVVVSISLVLRRGDQPQAKIGKIKKKIRNSSFFLFFSIFCYLFTIFPIFACGWSPRLKPRERLLGRRWQDIPSWSL